MVEREPEPQQKTSSPAAVTTRGADPYWPKQWRQTFHPVAPGTSAQGDISGGLLRDDGVWHLFKGCHGGTFPAGAWCHLTTTNLVDYVSHGPMVVPPSAAFPKPLTLGTGAVQPLPDGSGTIAAFINHFDAYATSSDGMRSWTARNFSVPVSIKPPGAERDMARPLQSASGDWYMMVGCGLPPVGSSPLRGPAAVCRYKASDVNALANWTFDGFLHVSNTSFFGQPLNFYEVPDFFPLDTHDTTVDPSARPRVAAGSAHATAGTAASSTALGNGTFGSSTHVLVVDAWAFFEGRGIFVHNVEWHSGEWAADGGDFAVQAAGCLDYGWWYAARSTASESNRGRRMIWGVIATDVTHYNESRPCNRLFSSLPRELFLASDQRTVHVRPPPELALLRKSQLPSTPGPRAVSLACSHGGRQRSLQPLGNGTAAEVRAILNISSPSASPSTGAARFGIYALASAAMAEAVYISYNGSHAAIDTRNSSINQSASLRTLLTAPLKRPASGVVQLAVYIDETVIELFASDCVCAEPPSAATRPERRGLAGGNTLEHCECDHVRSSAAVAITSLAFPAHEEAATNLGLFASCDGEDTAGQTATALVQGWLLRPAPVTLAEELRVPA